MLVVQLFGRQRQEDQVDKAAADPAGQARGMLADQVVSHLHSDKLGGTTGEQDRLGNSGFQSGKRKPQILWV